MYLSSCPDDRSDEIMNITLPAIAVDSFSDHEAFFNGSLATVASVVILGHPWQEAAKDDDD